jgi:hypothetical protein
VFVLLHALHLHLRVQPAQHVDVVSALRGVSGCAHAAVTHVDLRAHRDQHLSALLVSAFARQHQRGAALCGLLVHLGARFHQHVHDVRVAALGRQHKRVHALVVLPVYIHTSANQALRDLNVAFL